MKFPFFLTLLSSLLFVAFCVPVSLLARSGSGYADTLCNLRGVVNVSVANLHREADFESPMETQTLLGMPVRIRSKARWYQVETLDGYVAWVHRAVVVPMDSLAFARWEEAPKIVVTAPFAQALSAKSPDSRPVGDLTAGCILRLTGQDEGFYQVSYPDGRRGYVPVAQAAPLDSWLAGRRPTVENLIRTAGSLMGVPYLWAGTSARGVDCSGLIQYAALLNGIVLPRNASQQARIGQRVPCFRDSAGRLFASPAAADSLRRYPLLARPTGDFLRAALANPAGFCGLRVDTALLRRGDLLLFGRTAAGGRAEGIAHIGIYLGRGRYLHSQGFVHVSSLLPGQPGFDAMNHARFLGATRIQSPDGSIQAPALANFLR